jgi:hypothetical protein
MGQLISIAEGHFRNTDCQVTQIEQLQALVTEKDQINESDAMITQRNTIISPGTNPRPHP